MKVQIHNFTAAQVAGAIVASLVVCATLAIIAGGVARGWFQAKIQPGARGASGDDADTEVALIVSGDTAGWIVPCGCVSNQSGGLARRATFVDEQRRRRTVVLADAGGAPGGTSAYQRLKFEAILRGELAMGLAAHNLGIPEAALGAEYLRRVSRDLRVPFVSANLRDAAGDLVAVSHRIVEAGGVRIALVGVVSDREQIAGCTIDDPREALVATLAGIREQYDWAVALAYLPEIELRELAAAVPEAHVVVGGPTGQSLAPGRVGRSLIASATNKGKFLVQIEIPQTSRGEPSSGSVVELSGDFADDPLQKKNVRDFRRELESRDFPFNETVFATPVAADAPGDYRVAGTLVCRRCHLADCQVWDESAHAHAWTTLLAEGAHVDPECQRCHTTGYGLPGGFESVARSPQRTAVGCESCHGPSLGHARQPARRTPVVSRYGCQRCHDRENSPEFEFEDYWGRIVHGGPVDVSGPSLTESPNQE